MEKYLFTKNRLPWGRRIESRRLGIRHRQTGPRHDPYEVTYYEVFTRQFGGDSLKVTLKVDSFTGNSTLLINGEDVSRGLGALDPQIAFATITGVSVDRFEELMHEYERRLPAHVQEIMAIDSQMLGWM